MHSRRIHILVTMNPDGYQMAERNGAGTCYGVVGRLDGWLDGKLVGWLENWLNRKFVGLLDDRLVGWMIG